MEEKDLQRSGHKDKNPLCQMVSKHIALGCLSNLLSLSPFRTAPMVKGRLERGKKKIGGSPLFMKSAYKSLLCLVVQGLLVLKIFNTFCV